MVVKLKSLRLNFEIRDNMFYCGVSTLNPGVVVSKINRFPIIHW